MKKPKWKRKTKMKSDIFSETLLLAECLRWAAEYVKNNSKKPKDKETRA